MTLWRNDGVVKGQTVLPEGVVFLSARGGAKLEELETCLLVVKLFFLL